MLRAPGVLEAVDLVLKAARRTMSNIRIWCRSNGIFSPMSRRFHSKHRTRSAEGNGAIIVLHELTAQKRLEQMRADFVANASHELRTPLSSLSGFIDTLRGHARDDQAARERFLEIMHEQAARMRRLIEDLLSLSRIELNEHIKPDGRVALASVVWRCDRQPRAASGGARVKIETEIEKDVPDVVGARDELIQVVQNLIDNAIKYGGSGGRIVVKVGSAGEGEGRRSSYVAVQDFGEGIAREHLPRLTERFYRVDVQRSRQTGGTGLGLAIVKHIVSRHRGSMSIESTGKSGEGSTFTVLLPQAADREVPLPAESQRELAQPAA